MEVRKNTNLMIENLTPSDSGGAFCDLKNVSNNTNINLRNKAFDKDKRHCKNLIVVYTMAILLMLAIFIVSPIGLPQIMQVSAYAGGDGTEGNPYQISTYDHLVTLSNTPTDWDKSFILMNDITTDATSWTPIGRDNNHFTGVFNCNGYTISFSNNDGVLVGDGDSGANRLSVGFLGFIENAKIESLGVYYKKFTDDGAYYAGGIVGQAVSSEINECYCLGEMYSSHDYGGGISVGGILGYGTNSTITNCFNLSNINVFSMYDGASAGGIVGITDINSQVIVKNCYNMGQMTALNGESGNTVAGGIVASSYRASIINCFSLVSESKAPSVDGGSWPYIGGIAGMSSYSSATISVNHSYYDYPETDGGLGTRYTTNELTNLVKNVDNYSRSNYWDISSSNKWDFENVWGIDTTGVINDGYPYLRVFYSNIKYVDEVTSIETLYDKGSQITIKPISDLGTSKENYTFSGWLGSDGQTYSVGQNITITQDLTLTAQWTANTFDMTFDQDGGSGEQNVDITYGQNLPNSITVPSKVGYNFVGYYDNVNGGGKQFYNSNGILTNTSFIVSGDLQLFANWSPITYSIVFNGNGATSGSMGNQTLTFDTANNLTMNAFARTGYKFLGWATTQERANSGIVDYVNGDNVSNLASTQDAQISLYAVWELSIVDVTLNISGNATAILYIRQDNIISNTIFINGAGTYHLSLMAGETYLLQFSTNYMTNIIHQSASGQILVGNILSLELSEATVINLTLNTYQGNNSIVI